MMTEGESTRRMHQQCAFHRNGCQTNRGDCPGREFSPVITNHSWENGECVEIEEDDAEDAHDQSGDEEVGGREGLACVRDQVGRRGGRQQEGAAAAAGDREKERQGVEMALHGDTDHDRDHNTRAGSIGGEDADDDHDDGDDDDGQHLSLSLFSCLRCSRCSTPSSFRRSTTRDRSPALPAPARNLRRKAARGPTAVSWPCPR